MQDETCGLPPLPDGARSQGWGEGEDAATDYPEKTVAPANADVCVGADFVRDRLRHCMAPGVVARQTHSVLRLRRTRSMVGRISPASRPAPAMLPP